MTAHNEGESFSRQLLLIATNDKAVDIAENFVDTNAKELELEESKIELEDSAEKWLRLWEQKNLEASRKQVAPMLREAMGG